MADEKQKAVKEVKVELQVDDDIAQGMYTNLAAINHSENEFVFDFIFLQPQSPKAKVRSRVILSAKHAKRFLNALQENIRRYENNFGKIEEIKDPAIDTSFMH
ncbi:MAG: DUF3467 domain-containing protein [Deltaproteobacteria bacterium]